MTRRKAKVVARGIDKISVYLSAFHRRSPDNSLTMVTPFKTSKGAYIYLPVNPDTVLDMFGLFHPSDLSMSDRIVIYRLDSYTYHLTFEGLEDIAV